MSPLMASVVSKEVPHALAPDSATAARSMGGAGKSMKT